MDYEAIERRIKDILKPNQHLFPDSARHVHYYLEHGEPEMAYEGLCIEIMAVDRNELKLDTDECLALGRDLDLHRESVFDDNVWVKFTEYLGVPSLLGFRIYISDLFHFENGQTLFVGTGGISHSFVHGTPCDLFVDGKFRQSIKAIHMNIPNPVPKDGKITFSTTETVNLEKEELSRTCWIQDTEK